MREDDDFWRLDLVVYGFQQIHQVLRRNRSSFAQSNLFCRRAGVKHKSGADFDPVDRFSDLRAAV